MLTQVGMPMDRFIYVEDGEVKVADPFTGGRLVPSTIGPTQFVGETVLLSGGTWSVPMRAGRGAEVIEVPRAEMLWLLVAIPELSDIVITVLAARRQREAGDGMLAPVREESDRAVRRVAEFAARNCVPYRSYALGSVEAAVISGSYGTSRDAPLVSFDRDLVVPEPTTEKVARLLGLDQDVPDEDAVDVLIVGVGPAGVATGVYAGAEWPKTLEMHDTAIG